MLERQKLFSTLLNYIIPKSRTFVFLKRNKPFVVCIYDYEDWILGSWAKEIEELYGEDYDILSISYFSITKEIANIIATNADAVFFLLAAAIHVFGELRPKKIICAIHHWTENTYNNFYTNVISIPDIIVTGAHEWKEKIMQKAPDTPCIVAHSGAKSIFTDNGTRTFMKNKKFKLLFSGKANSNEEDRKGTRHLISLLTLIVQNNLHPHYMITVTGIGWEKLIDNISKIGFSVNYCHSSTDIELRDLYNDSDIYLMLSDIEGGPATIAEAMACGAVVLATRIGLAKDIIEDTSNGFFVDNSDAAAILSILEFLRSNPDIYRSVSSNAADFAEKHLRFSQTFKSFESIFSSITADVSQAIDREHLKYMIRHTAQRGVLA
jgi:glycosyltransferase involved in cell wall biosynthesis